MLFLEREAIVGTIMSDKMSMAENSPVGSPPGANFATKGNTTATPKKPMTMEGMLARRFMTCSKKPLSGNFRSTGICLSPGTCSSVLGQ